MVQPEGQPYFYNDSAVCRFRFLTEADLFNLGVLSRVNVYKSAFEEDAKGRFEEYAKVQSTNDQSTNPPPTPEKVEVVLLPHATENTCSYYMVDIDKQCVFWIDCCPFDGHALGFGEPMHLSEFS